MGKSSLSVTFFRVVEVLNDISSVVIAWPPESQLSYIQERFKSFAGLNNVIGAIDGTFVPIKAPNVDPEVYVTRKCNYAEILQAVCDCDLKFIDVFMGYPGSVSDTRVFRNSDLYKRVEENPANFFPNEQFIIGDKAYPTLTWCMSPYIDDGKLTQVQKNFNHIHAKTRQVIERAFALLFGCWRRLKFIDMNRHDFIPYVVLAACTLHNICLNYEDLYREQYIIDGRENINNDDDGLIEAFINQTAKTKRDNISQSLNRKL